MQSEADVTLMSRRIGKAVLAIYFVDLLTIKV